MSASRTDVTRVAVVVPVFRNGACLPELVRRLDAALDDPWRLRLVVDACPDGSLAVAEALAATDRRVRVTSLPVNVGQHRALAHGLSQDGDADVWVCMDGDLQDPPEAVPGLLAHLERGVTAGVFAGRCGAYERPGRRLTGGTHRLLLSALTGLPRDAGAFLVMRRPLRDAVVAGVVDRGAPSVVAAAGRSGLALASLPVQRDTRVRGVSAWTSRARLRQSLTTLRWALRDRRRPA